jgi:aerobic carbon-monoxide dehydrogenase large subunit
MDIDPVELRRRNLIPADSFPYETGVGSIYDSGSYRVALDLACERLDYEAVRAEQLNRDDGVLVGLGVASYVELSSGGQEYGEVGILADGTVTVKTGTSPHGQGHRTTWAQIAADELGVGLDAVKVIHGDTAVVPRGGGTGGSRSAALGGTAVGLAAVALADRIRELAAERLEADRADIRLVEGSAVVTGTDIGVTFAELAEAAGGVLAESTDFVAPGLNYPFGTHGCVVEIDRTTGEVAVRAYVAVDDCGRVINPVITEGQVHGGIGQGAAHALFEGVRHDASGNLLTANWSTYRIPGISDLLPIDAVRTETPTPNNPLGIKGVGEAGATGSTPAVANAVIDALSRAGVDDDAIGMSFTPDKVWAALQGVEK